MPGPPGKTSQSSPPPLSEQLKPFEANVPAEKPVPKPEAPATVPTPAVATPPKPEPKPEVEPPSKWTLQLVSTTDAAEAARVAAKAKAAGYATVIVKDKKQLKVRLAKTTSKEAADATAKAVKAKGFKPFPVKAD